MTDTLETAEKIRVGILKQSRLEGFVTPLYGGYCVSNVAPTILSVLGVKTRGRMPIPRWEFQGLLDGARRVVLILIDSLGYTQLLSRVRMGSGSVFSRLIEDGALIPLTSTFSSTTPTALASISTGATPQEHGVMGYSLYLKEFGVVANMMRFSPAVESRHEVLQEAGLDLGSFLGLKTVHEALADEGCASYVLTRWFLRNSSMTQILHRGAEIETYADLPDMILKIGKMLKSKREGYIFAYWDALDIISHIYGPRSEEATAELRSIEFSLKTGLLDRLGRGVSEDTLLLMMGDHGQHPLAERSLILASDHPRLMEDLQIPPTGSSRAVYLHPKPGRIESVRRYLSEKFRDRLMVLDSGEALNIGLFGHGDVKREVYDRIGDLIVIPKGRSSFLYPYRQHKEEAVLKGGHGGLSEEEMLTPLLALRLNRWAST